MLPPQQIPTTKTQLPMGITSTEPRTYCAQIARQYGVSTQAIMGLYQRLTRETLWSTRTAEEYNVPQMMVRLVYKSGYRRRTHGTNPTPQGQCPACRRMAPVHESGVFEEHHDREIYTRTCRGSNQPVFDAVFSQMFALGLMRPAPKPPKKLSGSPIKGRSQVRSGQDMRTKPKNKKARERADRNVRTPPSGGYVQFYSGGLPGLGK